MNSLGTSSLRTTSKPLSDSQHFFLAVVIIQALFVFGLLCFSWFCSGFQVNAEVMIYPLCLLIVLLSLWIFSSWWFVTGTLFDLYTLFVLSAVLFSGGQAFLEVFGLNDNGILANRFSSDITLWALLVVALGLSGMHLGAILSVRKTTNRSADSRNVEDVELQLKSLRKLGWCLLALSAIPMLITAFDALMIVWEGGYFALYQQERGVGLLATPQILAQLFIPSIFLFVAANGGSKRYVFMSGIMMFSYSASFLSLGWRYYAVAPLLCYVWLWHTCWRPLPYRTLLLTMLVFLGFVFPLIKGIRNVALAERFSVDALTSAYVGLDNPIVGAISEMGGSLITIAYVLDLVPWSRPFDYGLQYLYSLLTILPNVFGGLHPAIMRGTPANWLIWTVDPFTAARGGSIGFSFMAEAFLNFGFWGVPVALFLIGFLYVKLLVWGTQSHDLGKKVLLAVFASYFLFFPRSDSTVIFRPLVWYGFFPYLLYRFLMRFRAAHH